MDDQESSWRKETNLDNISYHYVYYYDSENILRKIEYKSGYGYIAYYEAENGRWHNLNGPARIFSNDNKEWWIHGIRLPVKSQAEFEHYLKLKAFW